MRRRDFIKAIAGSATSWPLAARAQQPEKMQRIGYLTLLSGPSVSTEGLQRGLSQLGYVEGQNLIKTGGTPMSAFDPKRTSALLR
jgi:putative ABC transport system substrate-binding protein